MANNLGDTNFKGEKLSDCPIGGYLVHSIPYTGVYLLKRISETEWVSVNEKDYRITTTETLLNAYDDMWWSWGDNWDGIEKG